MEHLKLKGLLNFVILGAKSTGKTWYIKNLNKRKEISAIDNKTIEYLEAISATDAATNISYTELYFNYMDDKYNIEFQMDDYDGNFVESWHSNENKEYKEKLSQYVKDSEGIFIFLEYIKDARFDDIRFKNMEREIDVFINLIKEEYGEEHNKLPIPVVFVVSKWDLSPYFKSENEIEEAKKYINSNEHLKNIQEKVSLHFKNTTCIPLSSKENYNIIKPIRFCLDFTFEAWEKTIEELQQQNNKEELLEYLSEKLHDMRFYKDGKYKKLYNEIESEFANSYLPKLFSKKILKEFESFYNEHKNIFESLSEENQEKIYKHKEKLQRANKTKKTFMIFSAMVVVGIGIFGYYKYSFLKAEKLTYDNIKIEYAHNNYIKTLQSIKEYYIKYKTANKEHLKDIKTIEENIKQQVRAEIKQQLNDLKNIVSLLKAYQSISTIYNIINIAPLSDELKEQIKSQYKFFNTLKNNYTKVNNLITELSLETVDKERLDKILRLLNTFNQYDEYKDLQKSLKKKLNSIKAIVLNKDDNDEKSLSKFIEIASVLGMSDEEIEELNNKLKQVKLENSFKEFMQGLEKNSDIQEMINYVNNKFDRENFNENHKARVSQYLNSKFKEYIKEKLGDIPEKIENIDDFTRLRDKLNKIFALEEQITQLPINDTSPIDIDMQQKIQEKLDLYKKYNEILTDGVETKSLTFCAQEGNKLGIDEYDDEIEIYINDFLVYRKYDAFRDGSVRIDVVYNYKPGKYNIKVVEVDAIENDEATGAFTLTKNDIIKLYNGKYIEKSLNLNYNGNEERDTYCIIINF